jgi:hypothetical protein
MNESRGGHSAWETGCELKTKEHREFRHLFPAIEFTADSWLHSPNLNGVQMEFTQLRLCADQTLGTVDPRSVSDKAIFRQLKNCPISRSLWS